VSSELEEPGNISDDDCSCELDDVIELDELILTSDDDCSCELDDVIELAELMLTSDETDDEDTGAPPLLAPPQPLILSDKKNIIIDENNINFLFIIIS